MIHRPRDIVDDRKAFLAYLNDTFKADLSTYLSNHLPLWTDDIWEPERNELGRVYWDKWDRHKMIRPLQVRRVHSHLISYFAPKYQRLLQWPVEEFIGVRYRVYASKRKNRWILFVFDMKATQCLGTLITDDPLMWTESFGKKQITRHAFLFEIAGRVCRLKQQGKLS